MPEPDPHHSQGSRQAIVAAVDGSDASAAIIQWGWALAERSGAVLHLIVVSEQSAEHHSGAADDPTAGLSTPANVRSLAETTLGARLDVEKLEVAVLHGVPVEQILAETDQCDAALLVIGRRGHGRLSTLRLGSVSNRCTDQATRPVLVVDGFHEPRPGQSLWGLTAHMAATRRSIGRRTWPRCFPPRYSLWVRGIHQPSRRKAQGSAMRSSRNSMPLTLTLLSKRQLTGVRGISRV